MAKNQTNNSTNRTSDSTQKTTNRTQQSSTSRTNNSTNTTNSKSQEAGFLRLPRGARRRVSERNRRRRLLETAARRRLMRVRPCHYNPLPGKLGGFSLIRPRAGGASATFPQGGRLFTIIPAYTHPTSR